MLAADPRPLVDALLFQSLATAALAAVVAVLLRTLGRRGASLAGALWSLVALRFVLPPDLAAPWSLRSLGERALATLPSAATTDAVVEATGGATAASTTGKPLTPRSLNARASSSIGCGRSRMLRRC